MKRLHDNEIMRRVDEITSQRQMREDQLAVEREVKVCRVSETLVAKKRKQALSEIFDMLIWSVEYTRNMESLNPPSSNELKTRESNRYSADYVLDQSHPETSSNHDAERVNHDSLLALSPTSVRFQNTAGDLRQKYVESEKHMEEDALDTNLANALLLQPKTLANVMEQIIANLRPSIISREEFMSSVEKLLLVGSFPPLNSILCSNPPKKLVLKKRKPKQRTRKEKAPPLPAVEEIDNSRSEDSHGLDQAISSQRSVDRAEALLRSLETRAASYSALLSKI